MLCHGMPAVAPYKIRTYSSIIKRFGCLKGTYLDASVFANMATANYGNSYLKEYTATKTTIQKMRELCLVVRIMS
jgi:hypothetical protein